MNPEDQRQPVGENITENVTILSPSQLEISTESLAPEQRSPTLDETRKELAKFLTYTLAVTIAASFVVVVALTIMSGFFVDEKRLVHLIRLAL